MGFIALVLMAIIGNVAKQEKQLIQSSWLDVCN
jgi:hypothetical protein